MRCLIFSLVATVVALPSLAQTEAPRIPAGVLLNDNPCDGELEAEACIGVLEYRLGDYAEAVRIWTDLARDGDIVAQRNLGLMYERGRGVPRDYAEARRWYRRAADRGDAGAELALGAMYDFGRGVREDSSRAASYYRRASDGGSARAAWRLARMYRDGRGVFPDERAWLRYTRVAAFRGFAEAQMDMGRHFFRRNRHDRDKVRACAFFQLAESFANDPLIRREAADWVFRVQDDVSREGRFICLDLTRQWSRDIRANGGRAAF